MKLIIQIALPLLLTSSVALAHSKGHNHGAGKAHVHGAGKMDVAFDGLKGEIDFDVSADAILGSEVSPKTEKEKTEEKQKLDTLAGKFKEAVEFIGANCQWTGVEVEVERHKVKKVEHAEVQVEADLTCEKPIKGLNLRVELAKFYPGLKKIDVQVNADDLQKGGVITPKTTIIELK